jgi:hypothetical protein
MSATLRIIALLLMLATFACVVYVPSVAAGISEELLPAKEDGKERADELPSFDPASYRSRTLLALSLGAQTDTACHWIDPFHMQGHVAEVSVPPPKLRG